MISSTSAKTRYLSDISSKYLFSVLNCFSECYEYSWCWLWESFQRWLWVLQRCLCCCKHAFGASGLPVTFVAPLSVIINQIVWFNLCFRLIDWWMINSYCANSNWKAFFSKISGCWIATSVSNTTYGQSPKSYVDLRLRFWARSLNWIE